MGEKVTDALGKVMDAKDLLARIINPATPIEQKKQDIKSLVEQLGNTGRDMVRDFAKNTLGIDVDSISSPRDSESQ